MEELDLVLEELEKIGVNVVLFLPNVEFDSPVPTPGICSTEWFRSPDERCNPIVRKEYITNRFSESFLNEVQSRANDSNNFYLFDPLPLYCPVDQQECPRVVDGIIAFEDTNHLTPAGAQMMLDDFVKFLSKHELW